MKLNTTCATVALSIGLVAGSHAAISLVAGTSGSDGHHMYIGHEDSAWNTVPAGSNANIYWDADNDQIFGETGIGENAGNSTATLGFTIAIIDEGSYYFAVEGFASSGIRDTIEFDIHNSDSSIQRVSITENTGLNIFDSNGDEWHIDYTLTLQGYGNVVDNITHTGGGDGTLDHKAVLAFTAVPEPSSATLLGLGGLALILRRRK